MTAAMIVGAILLLCVAAHLLYCAAKTFSVAEEESGAQGHSQRAKVKRRLEALSDLLKKGIVTIPFAIFAFGIANKMGEHGEGGHSAGGIYALAWILVVGALLALGTAVLLLFHL